MECDDWVTGNFILEPCTPGTLDTALPIEKNQITQGDMLVEA